jgi:uncharacterized protein (TIGR01777 family)
MVIVIPGGSGQVGSILARHFHSSGHFVAVLTRKPKREPWRTIHWNGETPGPWIDCLDAADVCINLAGCSVNCRYHAANRRAILDSRVRTTRLIGRAIRSLSHPPRLWINASTATIYRNATDRPMDELHGELGGNEAGIPDAWKFSVDVARAWEHAFFADPMPSVRRLAIRSAMTFSPDRGGVFDAFLGLVRLGLGGRQGNGDQYVSWIHDVDFARAVEYLIAREDFSGVVNLASPNPLPNRDFMRTLCRTWGLPVTLPLPRWVLEIGAWIRRTETELLLKSRRVVPGKLSSAGFSFIFPDWPDAASDLVARWRRTAEVA